MLVLGNILSLLGCAVMMLTGLIKSKKKILSAQMVQFALQSAGHLVLGSMAGFLCGVIGIVRIPIFQRCKVTVWLKLGFIALQAMLTVVLDASSLTSVIAWLPVAAAVIYIWYLDTPSAVVFKVANIACQLLWVVHDGYYLNFAAVVFDVLTIVTTTVGVAMLLRERKKVK